MELIDKRATIRAICSRCEREFGFECETECNDIKVVRNQPTYNDWILIKNKIPDLGKRVLWCNKQGGVFIGAITYYKNKDSWSVNCSYTKDALLAWMELPEGIWEE